MDYLWTENRASFPAKRVPEPTGPKTNVRLYGDSPMSDLVPTGAWRNLAEAKRRQEKEAAAGASA